ncbi:NUDIX hydrolase [Lysinibacillus sp. 2017]|uniref:NUDIX domain-containing protein n=1 Tax=unclassified Lysinibacillus TaxID=2636778 RepID=UPI000D529713|nr:MULTISPECIES: NUDIX hydrolase [unclassified Lysinibacillus]AWE08438.1 NUDIX hydrolase [Lysinibacillus sp. 2017]TGN34927.1 NUDIX hydrolase [Lysinibacillus sp. S2017]
MGKDRGKVWLGVAAIVENERGEWLLVKKTYGGLKGAWSLPAGFVQQAETVTTAAMREVLEETGVACSIKGLVGFRSGVILNDISDNMAIFYCKPVEENPELKLQEREIIEACWMAPKEIAQHELSSVMLKEMANEHIAEHVHPIIEDINPGDIFGYNEYHLYFKK